MTTMKKATEEQISMIKQEALNDVTRSIASDGVILDFADAEDLGDSRLAWLRDRLGVVMTTDDRGVCFRPRSAAGEP